MQNYEYKFIEAHTGGIFQQQNYMSTIQEMAEQGRRFVSCIPESQNAHRITHMIIVFERPLN